MVLEYLPSKTGSFFSRVSLRRDSYDPAAWIQTLSEKVTNPPNYSKLYPKQFLRRYDWIPRAAAWKPHLGSPPRVSLQALRFIRPTDVQLLCADAQQGPGPGAAPLIIGDELDLIQHSHRPMS